MGKRRTKNEAFNNLQRVVDSDKPTVVGSMDVVMADAVQDNIQNEKHIEEMNDEMKKTADVVTHEKPEDKETSVKNDFTAKLILDESVPDFKLHEDGRGSKVYDDDGMDPYLDYDMFDFIYGLVTDCWPKPLNPLNHRMRKFMYIGSDKYIKTGADESSDGHNQVSGTGNDIEVSANEVKDFDDIKEICELYKFKYKGPTPKRSKATYWNYSFIIYVPCVGSGYPYMVEDYFETLGKTMEDVMPTDFCNEYRKRQAKVEKESQKYINEAEVDKLIDKAITAAAQDNSEPLQNHLKGLYTTLTDAGLTYQKSKVKKKFMDAFDDPDEEDE